MENFPYGTCEFDRISAAEAQGWTGPWRFGNKHLYGTPPGGIKIKKRQCGDHVPEEVDLIIVRLHRKIASLEADIKAVKISN